MFSTGTVVNKLLSLALAVSLSYCARPSFGRAALVAWSPKLELKLLTTSTTVLTVPDTAVVKVHLDSSSAKQLAENEATLEKPGASGSSSILCETSWRQGLFP